MNQHNVVSIETFNSKNFVFNQVRLSQNIKSGWRFNGQESGWNFWKGQNWSFHDDGSWQFSQYKVRHRTLRRYEQRSGAICHSNGIQREFKGIPVKKTWEPREMIFRDSIKSLSVKKGLEKKLKYIPFRNFILFSFYERNNSLKVEKKVDIGGQK